MGCAIERLLESLFLERNQLILPVIRVGPKHINQSSQVLFPQLEALLLIMKRDDICLFRAGVEIERFICDFSDIELASTALEVRNLE